VNVDFPAWPRDRVRMASRLRRGDASGPAEWLLAFLQARDHPPRARVGSAAGPAEWLLAFLAAATTAAGVAATEAATARGGEPGFRGET
jgi:hypothetical protein